MWFRSLFDTLLARTSRPRSPKRRLATSFRRRYRSFRPLLEILEDRTVPSGYQQLNLVGYQSAPAHYRGLLQVDVKDVVLTYTELRARNGS
jgi:hypothetical protein